MLTLGGSDPSAVAALQVATLIGHIEARNLLPAVAVLQALAPNTRLRLSVVKDYGETFQLACQGPRPESHRMGSFPYSSPACCTP